MNWVFFVAFCLCATTSWASGECTGQQCYDVLQFLSSCNVYDSLSGGANAVVLCDAPFSKLAMRVGIVAETPTRDVYFFKPEDMKAELNLSDPLATAVDIAMSQFSYPDGEVRMRRLIRMTEHNGEVLWRDMFSWSQMTYQVAKPIVSCLGCLQFNKPIKVYGGQELFLPAVHVSVDVLRAVEGTVTSTLSSLSELVLMELLVGYHLDLAKMADANHLHDNHGGNLLVTADKPPEIRWHDFGESFGVLGAGPPSGARIKEFASHLDKFVRGIIERIKLTMELLAQTLKATHEANPLDTQNLWTVRMSLRLHAEVFAQDVLREATVQYKDRQRFLTKVSPGFSEQVRGELSSVLAANRRGVSSSGIHTEKRRLNLALDAQEAALHAQEGAQKLVDVYTRALENAIGSGDSDKVQEAESKVQEAKREVQIAESKVQEAKREVQEAKREVQMAENKVNEACAASSKTAA